MRFSLEAFQRVQTKQQRRALWLMGLAIPGCIFASFWVLLGILIFFFGETEYPLEHRSTAFIILVMGFTPLSIFGFMLWRGIRTQLRLARFRNLAAVAQQADGAELATVSSLTGLSSAKLTATLLDAKSLGFVSDLDEAGLSLSGHDLAPAALKPRLNVAPDGSLAGSLLGNYRLDVFLSSGNMGDVYVASHVRTGRKYAVKLIRRDLRWDADALRRFEREALAASRLGHPGIIAVHDYGELEDGTRYLVMDLLSGETLADRLARMGSLPVSEALRLGIELASALAAAHAAGILHRDIKPANIFLVRDAAGLDRPVLLDFGLAKPADDPNASRITATGAAVGTPMYMAPEQARGLAVDRRSDSYGLAAVIFEMVTGSPPFMDQTLASVYARLLTEVAPRASTLVRECPPALDHVLERALAKNPDDRFASVEELSAALASVHVETPPMAARSAG